MPSTETPPAPRQKITCRFRSEPIHLSRSAQPASGAGMLIPRFQRRTQACRCTPSAHGERVAVRVSDEGVRCLVCRELIAFTQDRPPDHDRPMALLVRVTPPEVVVSLPVPEAAVADESGQPGLALLWDRYTELSAAGDAEDLAVERRSLLHRFIDGIVNGFHKAA